MAYKSLRQLCLESLGPPDPSRLPKPKRRGRGPAMHPYGQVKAERLDLHAQLMRERFGPVEDYEAEAKQKPKGWIKPPQ